jgi:hypothetical protein
VRLVLTLLGEGGAEVVEAQLAFHLHAAVDVVLVPDGAAEDEVGKVLAAYERRGTIRRAPVDGDEADRYTRLARLAATEHGADWVINARPGEFWWPRGGSLKDVLSRIPERYTIVNGLRRPFAWQPEDGESFAERMTMRGALENSGPSERTPPLAELLRPVHRADPQAAVAEGGRVTLGRSVPLRAWYPIEVLSFPSALEAEEVSAGALVEDVRLRDALQAMRTTDGEADQGGERYTLAEAGAGLLTFAVPDIVEEAAYAVECAAVGEVDLPALEREIAELEERVAWLEQRFWLRVHRTASRLLRRR